MKNIPVRERFTSNGFTLIELLVAISLSSMVFILVGSFMAFLINRNSRSETTELFEQAKNDLVQEMSNSIKWAKNLSISGNHVVADGVNYTLADGRIIKNGQPIVPDGVTINSFEVTDYSVTSDLYSLQIRIEMQSTQHPLSKDELKLVVSQRLTEVQSE
jgi:prepilin-type N-terminal cleavage/methylation domain-containing protein